MDETEDFYETLKRLEELLGVDYKNTAHTPMQVTSLVSALNCFYKKAKVYVEDLDGTYWNIKQVDFKDNKVVLHMAYPTEKSSEKTDEEKVESDRDAGAYVC